MYPPNLARPACGIIKDDPEHFEYKWAWKWWRQKTYIRDTTSDKGPPPLPVGEYTSSCQNGTKNTCYAHQTSNFKEIERRYIPESKRWYLKYSLISSSGTWAAASHRIKWDQDQPIICEEGKTLQLNETLSEVREYHWDKCPQNTSCQGEFPEWKSYPMKWSQDFNGTRYKGHQYDHSATPIPKWDSDVEYWYYGDQKDKTAIYAEPVYTCKPCDDPNIPFPEKVDGWSYSPSWREIDTDHFDCGEVKGQTESAYYNCMNSYRCKWRDGWEWNPNPGGGGENPPGWENPGKNIYKCVGVRGPIEVAENFSYEYDIYFEGEIYTEQPITIFLSYGAGTLVRGIDFNAPDRIIVQAGSRSAKLVLTTNTYCDDRTNLFIQIDPTSSVTSVVCDNIQSRLVCGPPQTYCEKVNDNCSVHYFFEPYGHRTRKANNM